MRIKDNLLMKYQLRIIIEIVISLCMFLLSLIPTYLMKQIIDYVSMGRGAGLRVELFIYLAVFYLVVSVLAYYLNYYFIMTRQKYVYDLRKSFIEKISRVSYVNFKDIKLGDILYLFTKDLAVTSGKIDFIISFTLNLAVIVSIMAILFSINVKMTMVVMLLIPIYTFISFRFKKRLVEYNYLVKSKESEMTSICHDFFANNILFKVFNVLNSKIKSLGTYFEELIGFNKKILMYEKFAVAISTTFISMWSLFAIAMSMYFYNEKEVTLGSMVMFVTLLNYVYKPISDTISLLYSVQAIYVSEARLEQLYSLSVNNSKSLKGQYKLQSIQSITVENLSVRIGNSLILNDLSFDITNNTNYIYGDSGSGKTTLMYTLLGLIKYNQGRILINGIEIERIEEFHQHVAVCFDEPIILNESIVDNIVFFRSCDVGKVEKILSVVGLEPDNYGDSKLDEGRIMNMSKGEKQRIALARAIYGDPKLLLMDEALTGVGFEKEKEIMKNVRQFHSEITIVSFTHRTNIASKSDYVISPFN